MSIKDPTGRLARWSLKLQDYDFSLEYRPGKNHTNAELCPGENTTMLKPLQMHK